MNNFKQLLEAENLYFGEANIAGIPCTIGYKKEFRWSWFATQLNTFVVIGNIDTPADAATVDAFSLACFQYACKNNQGWPRGLQSGVGSLAILCAPSATPEAAGKCEKLTRKHWSAFEVPIVFDLSQKRMIRFKSNPMWGSLYFPFFATMLDAIASRLREN